MAKFKKPVEKWHDLRLRCDRDNGELLLVGKNKRNMYVWVGMDEGDVLTFSGQATLRKLALRILEIVGEEK